jgi:hypothetical protein
MAPRLPKKLDRDAPFRVKAADAEDLAIVAAYLQDAVLPANEMTYDAEAKRFVAIMSRFRWERLDAPELVSEDGGALYERVHTAVRFEDVSKVRSVNMNRGDAGLILELLSIGWTEGEVELVFSGDKRIRLDVEGLSCHVEDLGEPWTTPFRPHHD